MLEKKVNSNYTSVDLLKEIRQYMKLGKMSFFVGTGVSAVSGAPLWKTLIAGMAHELDYNHSYFDAKNYDNNKICEPVFTSDEYLKIPQLYYIEHGKEKYTEFVKISFKAKLIPNAIHDKILHLYPNHILTTNYDTLIEDAASKSGTSFSVINSDEKISSAQTSKYILKIHGDFNSNFVLKEEDYLDYENNYNLIDKLMKTIFATNLVIFIGYSLNDYNVRLILNWVKNAQKDSFVKPIFINIDSAISNVEKKYRYNQGIRVLSLTDFVNDETINEHKDDYTFKYETVLDKIMCFNFSDVLKTKEEKLDYIYDKAKLVSNLDFLTLNEFNALFKKDYSINNLLEIEPTSTYLQDFLNNKNEYEEINLNKCNEINLFLKKFDKKEISFDSKFRLQPVSIDSHLQTYNVNITEFCDKEYDSLKDKYKKAYFLTKLGKYEESYNLYSDVIRESLKLEQWDLYYFSQINKYHVYGLYNNFLRREISFDGRIRLPHKENILFTKKIYNENEHLETSNIFANMPNLFKSQLRSLKTFCSDSPYIENYNSFAKLLPSLQNTTETTFSIRYTKMDAEKVTMLANAKFIYDNYILFDMSTFNHYVSSIMTAWLTRYQDKINPRKRDGIIFSETTVHDFTFTDLILITKTFTEYDIVSICNTINFKSFRIEFATQLKEYVNHQIALYPENEFSIDFNELRNLLLLNSQFIGNDDDVNCIIQFLLKEYKKDVQHRNSIYNLISIYLNSQKKTK